MDLKFLLVCFIVVKTATSFNAEREMRIVGGETAYPGQFPYQVSVQWGMPPFVRDYHICGGTILNNKWILTGGNCIEDLPNYGRVFIIAGKHNISGTEPGEQQVSIKTTIVHERYPGGWAPYDIGLILLSKPLVFNQRVFNIDIPRLGAVYSGNVILSGWGSVSKTSNPLMPSLLQYANLTLIDLDVCRRAIKNIIPAAAVHYTNICTGPLTGGYAACKGDSGGPLVSRQNGQTVVMGIFSWGIIPCGFKGAPSVYTKVSAFTDWIETTMKRYT